MYTGVTSHVGGMVAAIAVLTGTAILRGGVAAADANQDEQFLELLDKEHIPAQENVPTLITTAHAVCRRLDGGVPVGDIVNEMRNYAFSVDPRERVFDQNRVTRTMNRFITAAVQAYCPSDQSKIASIAAYMHDAVDSGSDPRRLPPASNMDRNAHGMVLASTVWAVPSGAIAPPNPPQIPPPPPPLAQPQAPPRPVAAPPRPKQAPAPPQQRPPPPQQVEPPAVAPQPGGAGSGGGTGTGGNAGGGTEGRGGGGPVAPPPKPPVSPGWVRLAP